MDSILWGYVMCYVIQLKHKAKWAWIICISENIAFNITYGWYFSTALWFVNPASGHEMTRQRAAGRFVIGALQWLLMGLAWLAVYLQFTYKLEFSSLSGRVVAMFFGYGCSICLLLRAHVWGSDAIWGAVYLGWGNLDDDDWSMGYDLTAYLIPSYVPSIACLLLLWGPRTGHAETKFFDEASEAPFLLDSPESASRSDSELSTSIERGLSGEEDEAAVEELAELLVTANAEQCHAEHSFGGVNISECMVASPYTLSIPAGVLKERHKLATKRATKAKQRLRPATQDAAAVLAKAEEVQINPLEMASQQRLFDGAATQVDKILEDWEEHLT